MSKPYRQENRHDLEDSEIWDIVNEVDVQDLARVSGLDLLNSEVESW